ncbi:MULTISPECIES: ATP-binding cassette domain-containing protein [unclassified Halomonas]|uniref:ATP-binding cassette domain-containing protein n=1 Tax=unclassified Halomonas TaxID=2609666 RepID=UPI0007D95FBD|nr:ATP-binding cassette domain-containing protein [Halomonas sp. ALS9]MBT2788968.1 ABC transporter ATP-binding protein [Halomonas sp. ISL-106]MBT2799103.1 ABC transporter ATP-binding protein [Halomonas sp. ISL-104]OAL60258.1 ATPase [Halomonas sp. ALS9]
MLTIDQLSLQLPLYASWWKRDWATCLDAFSLTLSPGEVHAVVGASGAGKSLLAYSIMGLLPTPARLNGQLYYQGKPLDDIRQRQLRGRELALIPQSLSALDPLVRTQRQVAWAAQRAGQSSAHAWRSSQQALDHYQLDARAQQAYAHELSGGMARRVLTAMAHVSQAKLVIADEPSVGLDPHQRQRVLAALRGLADQGKTVMLITHDLRHALPIADRVTIMRNGKRVETAPANAFQGTGDSLTHDYSKALWQALPDNHFSTSETSRTPQLQQEANVA